MRQFSGVMEMLYILTKTFVKWVYTFVQTHQHGYLDLYISLNVRPIQLKKKWENNNKISMLSTSVMVSIQSIPAISAVRKAQRKKSLFLSLQIQNYFFFNSQLTLYHNIYSSGDCLCCANENTLGSKRECYYKLHWDHR